MKEDWEKMITQLRGFVDRWSNLNLQPNEDWLEHCRKEGLDPYYTLGDVMA